MSREPGAATELVLYAGCMPAAPFRDYVAAAASAGFDAITMWPLIHRRAQSREGLTADTMRRIAQDAGVRIADLDPVGDWLPLDQSPDTPALFKSVWSRQQFLDCADDLGIQRLTAVQLTPDPFPHELVVQGFVQLCDDAAERGLGVQLEFMPFSGIPDLATALRVVHDADRPNAGVLLDVCHFVRSGGTMDDLRALPVDRVTSVQLGDGPSSAPTDLRDEAMFQRALPGQGQFGVHELLTQLDIAGVRCPVGPEVYRRGWSERDPVAVAHDLMAATRSVR